MFESSTADISQKRFCVSISERNGIPPAHQPRGCLYIGASCIIKNYKSIQSVAPCFELWVYPCIKICKIPFKTIKESFKHLTDTDKFLTRGLGLSVDISDQAMTSSQNITRKLCITMWTFCTRSMLKSCNNADLVWKSVAITVENILKHHNSKKVAAISVPLPTNSEDDTSLKMCRR